MRSSSPGFTLVELLLSLAIVGILASLAVVAINPTRQMADARNTQRKFDVNSILNAFSQYSVDSGGFFQPKKVDAVNLLDACKVGVTPMKLCKHTTAHGTDVGECGHPDILCAYSEQLVNEYLADTPTDPYDEEETVADQAEVDYLVSSIAPGRFQVTSPLAENGQIIGAVR